MNLNSARELKQELSANILAKIQTTIRVRSASERAAGPLEKAKEPSRTLALGLALKGKSDFAIAVRIQARTLQASAELERIRKQAKGEVDVRYVGRVNKRAIPWYQQKQRPLLIGCSVGHHKVTAGTLGCFVKTLAGGEVCILSNNHVLANENRGKIGDDVLQPGAYDGGSVPVDVVAKLKDFVRLERHSANFVDCAIAALDGKTDADRTKLRGLGKLTGLGGDFLDAGAAVAKIGRTTGLTRGRVTAFELDNVVVGFDVGNLRFDNQIEIESAGELPFSDGGDSGSLIVADRLGVALLFAGSDQGGEGDQGLTYANPLRAVLDALKVDMAL
jgi:hypothetical protein